MIRWAGLALVAVAGTAAAQSAYFDARSAGQVGERFDGYLGYTLVQPSPQARTQTEAINIRRRALYSDLAQRRGVSPQEVGITAGCTLLARVAVGESYMLADGQWRRRAAGQAVPVPDYCTGG
ncbi:YdbL family protein [Sphingomonas glaciei]|uniref:YdbL family protein n=1 Tax=Sphingomonas glaciei TaxID=2938948 RepID=A0ABY5MZ70_9SPHN|nr:YdbL family protein [Sphingomonas glaciei]UUR08764.1 YdbL family protein [Sphingomonas glaciei]